MMMPPEDTLNDTLIDAACNAELRALTCDSYHHFYHYQASAQYLWLATTFCALQRLDEAQKAYDKAIFQDHGNAEAIEGKKALNITAPHYDKHPNSDLAFCASIGALPSSATKLHDEGMTALLAGNHVKALGCFNAATEIEPTHSNSFFARGKCWFAQNIYEEARKDFEAATKLSHMHHDAYHRNASRQHVVRGKYFLSQGEIDLAIADFSKALDLYRRNAEALTARAEAYRAKGNEALAQADAENLSALSRAT